MRYKPVVGKPAANPFTTTCTATISLVREPSLELPKEGDLQVVWIPEPPRQGLRISVSSPEEGWKVIDSLATYDLYLEKQGLAEDWTNFGCLNIFRNGEWEDWESEDGCFDLDGYMLEKYGVRR